MGDVKMEDDNLFEDELEEEDEDDPFQDDY